MTPTGRPTLDSLRARIGQGMSRRLPADVWDGPPHMADAASRIALLFGDAVPMALDSERLRVVVGRLMRDEPLSDRDLRLCATGATTVVEIDGSPGAIVDRDDLTNRLLACAGIRSSNMRMRRRLAFGLAHAFLLPSERPAGGNADHLSAFVLNFVRDGDATSGDRRATDLLGAVAGLFADDSTQRFWPSVLDSDETALVPLHRLRTPQTSWVWTRIVLDAIRECASWDDSRFVGHIDRLLDALADRPLACNPGLGAVLDRLAKAASPDEHIRLREAAIEQWGSPLATDRHPHWLHWTTEAARRMVASWIVRRVIAAFFETLAGDAADPRRTRFSSRYADHIDELWIYLGDESRRNGGPALREIRAGLGGRVRGLDSAHTNAFVMMIGNYAFVEFSTTGHAMYVYERDHLPVALARGVPTPSDLRDRGLAVDRMTHQGDWEARTVDLVGHLTGTWVRRRF